MDYFQGINTEAAAKMLYRELAKKYHPDRGGSSDIMKEINSQYDALLKRGFKTADSWEPGRVRPGAWTPPFDGFSAWEKTYKKPRTAEPPPPKGWKQEPPKEPNPDFWDKRVRELEARVEILTEDRAYWHKQANEWQDLANRWEKHHSAARNALNAVRPGLEILLSDLKRRRSWLFGLMIGGAAFMIINPLFPLDVTAPAVVIEIATILLWRRTGKDVDRIESILNEPYMEV